MTQFLLQAENPKVDMPHACPISFCQKRFQHDSFIGVHIRHRHMPETRLEIDISQYPENPFITPSISNRKRRSTDEGSRARARKEVEDSGKDGEEEEEEAAQNICTRCGESVVSSKMKLHMRTHKERPRFNCSECGQSYISSSGLKKHQMIVHTKMRLNCPMKGCGKTFSQRTTLRYHIQTIHTNPTKHGCSLCEKSFSIKSDLDVHVKGVHEGIKARCSYCGKDFLRPSERNRHEKQVHGAETQKSVLSNDAENVEAVQQYQDTLYQYSLLLGISSTSEYNLGISSPIPIRPSTLKSNVDSTQQCQGSVILGSTIYNALNSQHPVVPSHFQSIVSLVLTKHLSRPKATAHQI